MEEHNIRRGIQSSYRNIYLNYAKEDINVGVDVVSRLIKKYNDLKDLEELDKPFVVIIVNDLLEMEAVRINNNLNGFECGCLRNEEKRYLLYALSPRLRDEEVAISNDEFIDDIVSIYEDLRYNYSNTKLTGEEFYI